MNSCCGPDFKVQKLDRRDMFRFRRRKTSLICTLMVAAASANTARGEVRTSYPALLQDIVLEQIPNTNIYYVIGHYAVPDQRNEGHTSNAGFVVTSEGVVVFDALGTPSLGWALLQKIRSVTDQPVRYVVISHYHADHIYGLQAFRDHTDAVILAQDTARNYSNPANNDELAAPRLEQRRAALAPWVNESTHIVQPNRTFASEDRFELGGQRFRLVYAGPAHSSSDVMMLVEPAGVLFAGDIVQAGRIPFMASAAVDTKNWLRGLNEVSDMQPHAVIPGHGPLSTG
ncbi:MBL fold metallo-hydrolase, partial [Paeniroseomonas aquatica]